MPPGYFVEGGGMELDYCIYLEACWCGFYDYYDGFELSVTFAALTFRLVGDAYDYDCEHLF